MFGKLMKYDLRSSLRTMLPLWLTTIAMSAVLGLLLRHDVDPHDALGEFLLVVLPVMVLVLLMGAMFAVSLVFMVRGFSHGILGREGYLMFTLPVTTSALIASKALSALIIELLTLAAAAVSGCLLVLHDSAFGEIMRALGEAYEQIRTMLDANPEAVPCMIISCAGVLFWMLSLNLQTYFSFSVGQLVRKRRTALAIVVFCAVSIVMIRLTPVLIELSDYFVFTRQSDVAACCMFAAVPVAICAAYFFAARGILAHRLNLE